MKFCIKNINLLACKDKLKNLPHGKLLINTINAHSYNTALKDNYFAEALLKGDVLIPDGVGIVKAFKWLRNEKIERIAGWDLFVFEMDKLNNRGGICFFLGSSEKVLSLITKKARIDYPNVKVLTYSPPFKSEFSDDENRSMIEAINSSNPDLLWIGMTAPKQEKWIYSQWNELNINCHCGTIGAVFDFYAGTVKRAPYWWQFHSIEWLYRLIKEPKRMWRRYVLGNFLFLYNIFREKSGINN